MTDPEPKRYQLQSLLEDLLGSEEVYFQPPTNVKMSYPAIVYFRDRIDSTFAGNRPYSQTKRYQVTIIGRDPDSDIPDKIAALPMCSLTRTFVADNLYHDVFLLYF